MNEGKKILVTGASSGIGEAVTRKLAENGMKVIPVARNGEKLRRICEETAAARYYTQDLTRIDEIGTLTETIVSENGKLDGMVHCAGESSAVPLRNLKYEDLHRLMLINFYAFVELAKNVSLKKNFNSDGGSIIGISSIAGTRGHKGKVAYSSSKAAMDSAVRCMSAELAPKKIRVNTIAPGFIRTQMYERYLNRQGVDATNADIAKQPLGLGTVEDVVNAVVFLLSDESRFITGTTLMVDGGRTATD